MQRKPNRLKNFTYEGSYAYFLTICCYNNENYFNDENTVLNILEVLNKESSKVNFYILAYCFMPDHLHILTSGDEKTSLIKFVKNFKQITGYNFKKATRRNLWQKSFHDHIVRKEENLNSIVEYIFNNPVRKGIVEDYENFPFLGLKND